MKYDELPIMDNNLWNTVKHGDADFPIQYFVDELSCYPNQLLPLHWHLELEFYVAYGGPVEIQLGNTKIRVDEGNGIFINSNVLHSFRQIGECECKCPNIVFSHTLITAPDSRAYITYVQPIMTDSELPYLVFCQNCPWHKEILDLLDRVFSLLQKYGPCSDFYGEFPMLPFENEGVESSCFELEIQCLLNKIWQIIYTNRNHIPRVSDSKTRHMLEIRTQKMLKFIHTNYSRQITLKEIADSANISKSEASRCFQEYLQKSPVNYLLHYRLEKAKYFLQQSGGTINEIADKCGFQTTSYFGKVFRRETGMTASQYRNIKTY